MLKRKEKGKEKKKASKWKKELVGEKRKEPLVIVFLFRPLSLMSLGGNNVLNCSGSNLS